MNEELLKAILNILAYFIIYSFFGWMMESIFKTILQKKIVNSGFLYGPFCPIYGLGAFIMLLFLNYFKYNPVILFLMASLILTFWEYVVGILLEKLFQIKYWDYSERKFNFQGRICLLHFLLWGLLGTIFIFIVHPIIVEVLNFIPTQIITAWVTIIITVMGIDFIVTIMKLKNIQIKIASLKEITKTIKIKTEELKVLLEASGTKAKKIIVLNMRLQDLKNKQEEIKEMIYKQTKRLRKAFPTMKLKDLGEVINKRIKKIKGE